MLCFQEQMLLLPHVPAMNPPDEAAQVVMQSRTRKFPYSKGKLVTTEGETMSDHAVALCPS